MESVDKGNSVKDVRRKPSSQDLRKSPHEYLSSNGQALCSILACIDIREALIPRGKPGWAWSGYREVTGLQKIEPEPWSNHAWILLHHHTFSIMQSNKFPLLDVPFYVEFFYFHLKASYVIYLFNLSNISNWQFYLFSIKNDRKRNSWRRETLPKGSM